MSYEQDDRGPSILVQIWVLGGLALPVVLARIYTRLFVVHSYGWDDFFIILALAASLVVNIGDTIGISYGYGRHELAIQELDRPAANKWIYVDMMINFVCLFFMRTSVMIFVLRLLPRTVRWPFRFIYFALALNVVITLIALIMMGSRCVPFKGLYEKNIGAHCSPPSFITLSLIVNASLACLIDFITAAVPMFLLYHLKIKRRTKCLMYSALTLGLLTAGLSIGRAITIVHPFTQNDLTWNQMPCCLIGHYEEKLGIIVACLPALRQTWVIVSRNGATALRPHWRKPSTSSTTYTSNSNTEPTSALVENLKSTAGLHESHLFSVSRHSRRWSTKQPIVERPPPIFEADARDSSLAPKLDVHIRGASDFALETLSDDIGAMSNEETIKWHHRDDDHEAHQFQAADPNSIRRSGELQHIPSAVDDGGQPDLEKGSLSGAKPAQDPE